MTTQIAAAVSVLLNTSTDHRLQVHEILLSTIRKIEYHASCYLRCFYLQLDGDKRIELYTPLVWSDDDPLSSGHDTVCRANTLRFGERLGLPIHLLDALLPHYPLGAQDIPFRGQFTLPQKEKQPFSATFSYSWNTSEIVYHTLVELHPDADTATLLSACSLCAKENLLETPQHVSPSEPLYLIKT